MKGYKATYKGKCQYQVYEAGKIYTVENVESPLRKRGFQFCKNADDIFKYYNEHNNDLVLFEVEATGNIKTRYNKFVTDELKVIREIPKQEYNSLFTDYEFKFDSNNNLIWEKDSYNNIWEYKYDSNNNLILGKSEFGITEYKYDSNNDLIGIKNEKGTIWENNS